jgi:hypothetical protein
VSRFCYLGTLKLFSIPVFILFWRNSPHLLAKPAKFDSLVVSWSARLPFKLGDSGSILARISTQGLKIIEEKELPLH